jgi:hypothetical protein
MKPYIYIKSTVNGFPFFYYLHIKGGSGVRPWRSKPEHRYGGEFDYIVYYASPEQTEKMNRTTCERIQCREMGIPYGEGKTIKEAYKDYQKKFGRYEKTLYLWYLNR